MYNEPAPGQYLPPETPPGSPSTKSEKPILGSLPFGKPWRPLDAAIAKPAHITTESLSDMVAASLARPIDVAGGEIDVNEYGVITVRSAYGRKFIMAIMEVPE